jgi:predicted RecA/RadA family phage recombinase
MRTFVQPGETLDLTAPTGGVVSGQGYVIGSLFVIAGTSVPAGSLFAGKAEGVFDLAKLGTAVLAEGARVSWDDTNKRVVAPGTGFFPIGATVVAAGNGATVARVRLDGVSTAAA